MSARRRSSAKRRSSRHSARPSASRFSRDQAPFRLGPFSVTRYLADHSGFDAYSLLFEAGGRRLFYTGDLRGHGRKSVFDRLVADPPDDLHVTLMEGTALSRHDDGRPGPSGTSDLGVPARGRDNRNPGSGQGDLYACAD
jgi:mRNA degradation ribonuclease J1/J2